MSAFQNAPIPELLQVARDAVDRIVNRSNIFDPVSDSSLPQFDQKEVCVGRIIGRGGFCVVKEITKLKSSTENDSFRSFASERGTKKLSGIFSSMRSTSTLSERSSNWNADGVSSSTPTEVTRDFLINASRSKGRFVLKCVAEEAKNANKEAYVKGCIDLALETKYLASLNHPNILDVRAVSSTGPFEEGYFIIVDRLPEMLPKRLNSWMTVDRQTKGVTGIFAGGKEKVDTLLTKRLSVAFDIASALGYLHELRVVYRDLKPDNIGFDKNGTVKIFDFGLAKELNEEERTKNGLYRMTGFTGSVRFMSPEVITGRPYNQMADVYSFGMLLWYFMALEPPFGLYTPKMIRERVPEGNRPILMDAWPAGIKKLLRTCWSSKIAARPSFDKIMKVLKEEVAAVSPERAFRMTHHSATQPEVETSIAAFKQAVDDHDDHQSC